MAGLARPWIGDADVLRRPKGESLGGWSHFTATAGDFNGDGLPDILAGTEKGNLMWFPNHGKPGEPKFLGCRVLTDEKGPLDTGWYGAPFVYDWDNDGLVDLIVGTSGNVILWWKNVGTKAEPKLSFQSFVKVGDKRLEVPEEPVAEDYGTKKTFVRDYYNQPWIGDFTGDGLPDIVTGGYTTGRIWLYKATARDEKGVPELEYVGPVEADGKPIDTTWGAGPSVGDFDGDGKLDLVTGSWWWSGIPRDPAPGEIEPIMYYKGVGRGQGGIPQLAALAIPRRRQRTGSQHRAAVAGRLEQRWVDRPHGQLGQQRLSVPQRWREGQARSGNPPHRSSRSHGHLRGAWTSSLSRTTSTVTARPSSSAARRSLPSAARRSRRRSCGWE
jgi:hypothetical protein